MRAFLCPKFHPASFAQPKPKMLGFQNSWGVHVMADINFGVLWDKVTTPVKKKLVDMLDGTYAEQQLAHPPFDLMTDGGDGPNRRMRVDNGQTGFFARRMWALSYEFASTNPIAATPLVFRVIIPTNFIIHAHTLSLDQGGATLRTYAAAQGVEGGTFSTVHTPVSENSMTEQAAYAFQTQIASGGTFTPNGGQLPLTPLRVRAAGATAQQSSVGGEAVSEKGRAAGTYYAVIARMAGVSGDCTGVYNLVIEERP